jgi:toxin YoeB
MRIIFSKNAWEDYTFWGSNDRNTQLKINDLIKEILRTPYLGKGSPEALKHDLAGLWSRRIAREHRLVYKVEDDDVLIYSCRFNYEI